MRANAHVIVQAYAHAMICTTVAWDVPGAFGALPQWWPPVSYVTAAAGIAAACIAVLPAILSAPHRRARRTAGAGGPLVAAGILLGAWLLRGDAEIPPDPPLVIAEAAGAVLYVVSALRRPA